VLWATGAKIGASGDFERDCDMTTSAVSDHDDMVLEALGDPRFDFRTVHGLAVELNLKESLVRSILERHKDAVRMSSATDNMGNALYTLRDRPVTTRERFATLREAAGLSRSA
jgi:hypothetical protein